MYYLKHVASFERFFIFFLFIFVTRRVHVNAPPTNYYWFYDRRRTSTARTPIINVATFENVFTVYTLLRRVNVPV